MEKTTKNPIDVAPTIQECKPIKASHRSPISEVSSKCSDSYSPVANKIQKKKQASQSNTLDVWLSKTGQEMKRAKSNELNKTKSKDIEEPSKKRRKFEKENHNTEQKLHAGGRELNGKPLKHKQEHIKRKKSESDMESSMSSTKTSSQNVHSQTNTKSNSTKCKSELISCPNFNEGSSSIKSSKKKSKGDLKNNKEEPHPDSHHKKLEVHVNKNGTQNKHDIENKKLKKSMVHPSSSAPSIKKKNGVDKEEYQEKSSKKCSIKKDGNKHREQFNNNNDSVTKLNRFKGEVEKSFEKIRELDKSADLRKSSSTTTAKKDNGKIIWLSKTGESDKCKNRSDIKYNKLPIKIDSGHKRNLDKKSKSLWKKSRTNSENVERKSFEKHDKLNILEQTIITNSTSKNNSIWIRKREKNEDIPKCGSSTKYKKQSVKIDANTCKENLERKKSSSKRSRSETKRERDVRKSFTGQEKLDNYLMRKSNRDKKPEKKPKFSRSESSESCEFPSFKNTGKKTSKKPKKDDFLNKYGMAIPSVKEILKEQKDLEKYKQQIDSFRAMENKSFELPFSVKDLNKTQDSCKDILGCNHLSVDEITEAFERNLTDVSAIFHGKKYNDRHERFYNNTSYTLTTKDLCYNTSMIVFNFDQKEHMITLLKKEFDPEDKHTPYFFQVLLPELCMRIFMDTHGMTYNEAVKYLDTRPIVDD